MAKIKELRIKGQDGSFTESYEIGGSSDASDILLSSGTSVEDAITTLDDAISTTNTANAANSEAITALQNDKADTYHASTTETYGVGSDTLYGHVKITDSYSGGSDDPAHTALSETGASNLYASLSGTTETVKETTLSMVEGEILYLAPTILEGITK